MTSHSEAVRQRLRYGLSDRLEAQWAKARQNGHENCDGWTYDPRDAQLICSCGEVLNEGTSGDS